MKVEEGWEEEKEMNEFKICMEHFILEHGILMFNEQCFHT